jgi:predicted amidohydrolase YtcJ
MLLAACLLVAACHQTAVATAPAPLADRIFTGGTIVTMNEAQPVAEAVATRGGAIIAVGTDADVLRLKGPATKVTELRGRTMLPGFIDAHGHLGQLGATLATADLRPPPISTASSIARIQQILRSYQEQHHIADGQWLLGSGYDDTLIEEKRHPTRDDLDRVSTTIPIAVTHISGHLTVVNSKALELLHMDSKTPDPPGGVIQRRPGSREPNGVLEEHAAFALFPLVANSNPADPGVLERLHEAALQYASFGITTGQEDFADSGLLASLRAAAGAGLLPFDVIAFPVWKVADAELAGYRAAPTYDHHLRLGGAKITLDGSIQGYTAYLTEPYFKSAVRAASRGYPAMPQDEVNRYIAHFFERGWDIQAHTNGDAASEQLIVAVAAARKAFPTSKVRVTMVHAQTVREDQLDRMKELGIMPSFFSSHVYYWGDRHRDLFLGPARAARISPAQSAVRRGMRFSLHNDSPVVPPNILLLVSTAVTRLTTSDQVLGAEQAITPMQALKAVTLDAAWQNREDDRKGSIEVGKQADLVILGGDPRHVQPKAIRDIAVLETIAAGQSIFQAGANAK